MTDSQDVSCFLGCIRYLGKLWIAIGVAGKFVGVGLILSRGSQLGSNENKQIPNRGPIKSKRKKALAGFEKALT